MKKVLALLVLSSALLLGQNPNTPAFPAVVATDTDLLVANNGFGGTTLNGSMLTAGPSTTVDSTMSANTLLILAA